MRAWHDAGHRFREMPDRAACEAVRELASNAPADLLQVFSEEANPLATHALRRWIAWADEDAERWVREAPSRAVAALGVVGWVERDLEPGDARFSERLSRIGAALQARPRDEEIALWPPGCRRTRPSIAFGHVWRRDEAPRG